ncbi:MAG: hypothetical protein ACI9W6_001630 [Motiliproteus sp.]
MNKALLIPLIFMIMILPAAGGQFYIQGEAVKDISLTLGVSSIDFGDVYSNNDVDAVPVDFYVNAEESYDYRVEISSDDDTGVLQISKSLNGGYTKGSITYIETGTGTDQSYYFYVDLDTGVIREDISATITVMVAYEEIAQQ